MVSTHYLENPWNFSDICTVHISLSYRPDMKQLTERVREMQKLSLMPTQYEKPTLYRVIQIY